MISSKQVRSPLRYAGGKSRGKSAISQCIPEGTKTIASPFFGGGSLEIACAQNGIRIRGYDLFGPLVEFWQCIIRDPSKLAELVKQYHPLKKTKFYELQKKQGLLDSKYERAAVYFVLNRASFSGTTFSGGMSPKHPRFTKSVIDRLANFKIKNITVEKKDFSESIQKERNVLLYLDPPYLLEQRLYGNKGNMHKEFNHERLAQMLHKRNKWILSYNNSDKILKLYHGYKIIYPNWKYGMSNDKNSREVLILSHDIAEKMYA